MNEKSIFWFRNDLRISDNPALEKASENGDVFAIYIWDDIAPKNHKMGRASKVWLYHSLNSLNQNLNENLNIYIGDPLKIISAIISRNKIKKIFWNRRYEPWYIQYDQNLKKELQNMGIECKTFNASLLWEPWEIKKNDSTYYKVFTPFLKGCLKADKPRKPQIIEKINYIKDIENKKTIASLNLLSSKKWETEIVKNWGIGEAAAKKKLKYFLKEKIKGYKQDRDFPARKNNSMLSPNLRFGEISPNQIWYSVCENFPEDNKDKLHFLSELVWREFSYYLLYHFPQLPEKNFQKSFDDFQWQNKIEYLKSWQQGKTGYPIIDAGMRELWQTGYMHNRVRMITASFLTKNLLINWQYGRSWFWDCLLDADLANNSASWQWVAGSGVDAAPYFRIFNPILQAQKFDPEGIYIRKFLPELKLLPDKYIFKPWEADEATLQKAKIKLGKDYPSPILDLKSSREKALILYKKLKNKETKIYEQAEDYF